MIHNTQNFKVGDRVTLHKLVGTTNPRSKYAKFVGNEIFTIEAIDSHNICVLNRSTIIPRITNWFAFKPEWLTLVPAYNFKL